ncbi:MAG: LON peptidase substrate-binding domain-containing protein [Bacteroidetes bacterium]|nr:LON peptidase substrate-binding domain-containing protein [Bacteroidota bacterium]MBS1756239.1 LON peptidase substrate-binding domain-containing protein [Bacteroidota bacterium]
MTNFIPIFPLEIVVYPGEQLNLHIFEPRYKQLIEDCVAAKKFFGIPTVLDNTLKEMGTLMQIKEVSKRYDDGKMDIKTEGIQPFKILETIKELPEKFYGGAIVTYPNLSAKGSAPLMKKVLAGIRKLHQSLHVSKDFNKPDNELLSYDVAHHAGMSLHDEYYLLELNEELHRQEFINRHLKKVIPIIEEMDVLKGKIKMNGHFKNLEGYKF